MELFVFILLFLVLAIVSVFWGTDSRDTVDSAEWERRKWFYTRMK